jgi:folate-binding protein YgfZ
MNSAIIHDNSATTASSGDVRTEFACLISGCGVFDLQRQARISLSGKDRARWLSGMITNRVKDLPEKQGVYAFVLNPQGHILGDLYVFNRGESFLLEMAQEQTEKLLAIFRKYIIMDKVEIASDPLRAIGVAGRQTGKVLEAAGVERPELGPLQFADVEWQNLALTLVRSDNPGVESYEIWVAAEQVAKVRAALVNAGAALVGAEALELLRIACGIPRYGQDIRERDLPQETEQMRALNFTKGCYIGQEIVERIRSRGSVHRKFTGFTVTGPLPLAGTKIQSEGKDMGEVTSAASLPVADGDLPVALGYIRREAAESGKPLSAGEARLVVANVPFAQIFPTKS